MFALVYPNRNNDVRRFNARKDLFYQKGVIKSYNVIINGKKVYDQSVDSDIKWYEEIRKLTAEQGEDYTTGCLLDYEYIKNDYRLIAVDLSELDADLKAIQQIEFLGELKKLTADNNVKSMLVLKILE